MMSPFTLFTQGFCTGPLKPWRAGVILAMGLGLAACDPATNWRSVTPPEASGLTALFPCKPEHASRQLKLDGMGEQLVTLHLLSCEADGATWALRYTTSANPSARLQSLQALQNAMVRNVSVPGGPAATLTQRSATLGMSHLTTHPNQGHWWVQGHRPTSTGGTEPVTISAWQFSKGLHVFQATVWQNPLQVDDPRLQTFIEGFNFAD